ncbi:MAG: hypothetical protein LBF59_09040 [Prevotellaceae bacterium]|jgi:hypothetical protein|nr:hypothetical protein [Prevotellaceae bacterium]
MKGRFFLIISAVLCIFSCSLDEEAGYYSDSFGVVQFFDNNTQYIKSDEGEILIPDESISSFVETGDRVWISYTVEEENAKRDTLRILPYRITRVMPLNLQQESTLAENGVDLWTVWIAQGFLTFDFRIRARDPEKLKDHQYALVAPQKEIVDTLFINFRHDDGGDNYGVLCRTAVTLKLSDLNIAQDSVMLAIDYKNLAGVKQQEYRMYKKIQK